MLNLKFRWSKDFLLCISILNKARPTCRPTVGKKKTTNINFKITLVCFPKLLVDKWKCSDENRTCKTTEEQTINKMKRWQKWVGPSCCTGQGKTRDKTEVDIFVAINNQFLPWVYICKSTWMTTKHAQIHIEGVPKLSQNLTEPAESTKPRIFSCQCVLWSKQGVCGQK